MSFSARPGGAAFPSSHFHPLAGRTILQIVPELEAGGAERTTVDIADGLTLSIATVKSHVGRLLTKLNARDRAQLVIVAYETGLVTAAPSD